MNWQLFSTWSSLGALNSQKLDAGLRVDVGVGVHVGVCVAAADAGFDAGNDIDINDGVDAAAALVNVPCCR